MLSPEPIPTPAVDWTADPRFGDDDRPVGSLADLELLCRRRVAEIVGPEGPDLAGQVFRYRREAARWSDLTGEFDELPWTSSDDDALSRAYRNVFGADRWDDEETSSALLFDVLMPLEFDGDTAAKAHPWRLRETAVSLDDLLAEGDDVDAEWLIEEVWPHGGKVVLAASAKAGKSTLVGNVLRSLVDGAPLFGPPVDGLIGATTWQTGYPVIPLAEGETVFVADLELTRGVVRRWLRDQDIRRTDRIGLELYRGRVGDLDVRDVAVRAELAARLRAQRTRVIIVDPIGAALSALGIDENRNGEVRRYLQALDALVLESGASELLVVHHMGHQGERSRGGTAFRDWPDAEWRLVRPQARDGRQPGADSPRFFSASGRDVAIPETALHYAAEARRLSLVTGNRETFVEEKLTALVETLVQAEPGLGRNELEERMTASGVARRTARDGIRVMVERGQIHHHPGPNRSLRHHPGGDCSACPTRSSAA